MSKFIFLICLLVTSKTGFSEELRIGVGDPAPAITVDQWLRGAAIEKFEPGKTYIIEFWATWCPYCVQAIPHLNAFQQRWPEQLVVVSVASSEKAKTADEKIAGLEKFLSEQTEPIHYTI